MAWMQDTESLDLKSITVNPETMIEGRSYQLKITAYDTDNKGLKGVVITVEGCGLSLIKKTDTNGMASFTSVSPVLVDAHTGVIYVTAEYTGSHKVIKESTIVVSD